MNFSSFNHLSNKPKVFMSTNKPSYLQENNKPVTFDDFLKIVIILDESSSMMPIRENIIKSINDLISEQKNVKGKSATFTLVKFNNNINKVITNKLLTNVQGLSYSDYNPSGFTALYDAIGEVINWFRNEREVLMVIVTDGQENSSKRYTKTEINKMIDEKRDKNNWTYVYLSSDLNTQIQGNNIGLQQSNYTSNCCVGQNNFGKFIGKSLNSAITGYREKGVSVQSQL